jgi:hypothetical protein
MTGCPRHSFCSFKEPWNRRELGLQGISRRVPVLKNRVDPEIEQAVVDIATEKPGLGA